MATPLTRKSGSTSQGRSRSTRRKKTPWDRYPYPELRTTIIAEQSYCEKRVALWLKDPGDLVSVPRELEDHPRAATQKLLSDLGTLGHAAISDQAQPVDPAQFTVRLAMGGRMWLAESKFSADFQGFPLAGIPDAVCFEDGKAAAVHEYKFTDSTQLQMSHRVQLLIYGYLLEQSGFDVSNLLLTCVLIPRRFASNQQAVISPEAANLIRDAVADVARRQKASKSWRLADFGLSDGVSVIVRAFRYDRARAEAELTFFADFWSGTRMAWPTRKPEKCSRCLYNSLRHCNTSLIRFGATPTS